MGEAPEWMGLGSRYVRSKSYELELYRVLGVLTFSMRGIILESKPGHCSLEQSVVATQSLEFIELTSPSADLLIASGGYHHLYQYP